MRKNFLASEKKSSGLTPLIFLITFICGFLLVKPVSAAIYYVRADGAAINQTGAIGPVSNPVKSMNLAVFNASTFSADDTIYFSALGGDYTSQLTVPSSGDVYQDVTYEGLSDGAGGAYPMINVSANTKNAKGVLISGKNYITIKNFRIKGSGGAAAFVNSLSGTAGNGYTVKVKNIDILSNYGASDANNSHDCFSDGGGQNENSQAEYWDIAAAGCRPNPSTGTGSHQAFTLHEYAKARIHNATFGDSNYGYTGTKATQAEFYNTTMSGMKIGAISQGGNMADSGLVLCDSCTFIFNNGTQTFGAAIGASASSNITIQNSTINSTSSKMTPGFSNVNFLNNTFNINDSGWRFHQLAGILTMKNNIFNILNAGSTAFTAADYLGKTTGAIQASHNVFNLVGGSGSRLFVYNGTLIPVAGNILSNNIFNGVKNVYNTILIYADSYAPKVYNNTFYSATRAGTAIFNNQKGAEGADLLLDARNNIFYNINTVHAHPAQNNFIFNYNDYYNSANGGGANSITADPLFIMVW